MGASPDVIRPFTRSRSLHEFTSILGWDVFNRAVSGPLRETFHNPYIFTIGAIMTESGRYLKDELRESDSIYFFLDDQTTKVESTVAYQFNLAKRSVNTGLGDYFDAVTFRDDRFCYPLQVADLIAWQRHRRELDLSVDRGPLVAYKRLMSATPSSVPVLFPYKESGLKWFSERVEATMKADKESEAQNG